MPRLYVALDTETTGLNPERDSVFEVGAVRFQDGRDLGTFHRFVDPGCPLPPKVVRLTGIDPAALMKASPFDEIAGDLQEFVGDAVIVGHSIDSDLEFLRHHGLELRNPRLDTFELAGILMPRTVLRPSSTYGLAGLAEEFEISFPDRHRALQDALATRDLFRALIDRGSSIDIKVLEEIERLARSARWPVYHFFNELRQKGVRSAFQGAAIGEQLRRKGVVGEDALGLFAHVNGEGRALKPSPEVKPLDVEALAAALSPGGLVGKQFPGYEYRPQQEQMLRAVGQVFNEPGQLLVEAGTGTGKSLAYLLPAVRFAVDNGQRVVVSTNTINLQDQLFDKDIPDLKRLLPYEFEAGLLKGRGNYLCRTRLDGYRRRKDLSADEARMVAKILVWLPSTVTGDKAELFLPGAREQALWTHVSAEADGCLGEGCRYLRERRCFLHQARLSAEAAHVLVVNHSLLMSDAQMANRVLPDYEHLIIDEAHHLEETTTRQMTVSVSLDQMLDSFSGLGEAGAGARAKAAGLLPGLRARLGQMKPDCREEILNPLEAAQRLASEGAEDSEEFFVQLRQFLNEHDDKPTQYEQRIWIHEALRAQPGWAVLEIKGENLCNCLQELSDTLEELIHSLEMEESIEEETLRDVARVISRIGGFRDSLSSMVLQPSKQEVYWAELSARRGGIALHRAPLHVGEMLREQVFASKRSVILTSATLRGSGGFKYIRETLGLDGAEELAVGSPFDYQGAALVCLPTDIPEPGQPFYQRAIEAFLIDLCRAIGGRTLVLFTSNSQLEATYRTVSDPLEAEGVTVLGQGQRLEGSRSQVLQAFRSLPRSVLLGSRSFWEGVDVVGPNLSCVVMVRLPFAVPTDPIFAARSETFLDGFSDYAVPQAVLGFRQGFGRLIRSQEDRGVMVVLDRRILTKSYGRLFTDSLPDCKVRQGTGQAVVKMAVDWIGTGTQLHQV